MIHLISVSCINYELFTNKLLILIFCYRRPFVWCIGPSFSEVCKRSITKIVKMLYFKNLIFSIYKSVKVRRFAEIPLGNVEFWIFKILFI